MGHDLDRAELEVISFVYGDKFIVCTKDALGKRICRERVVNDSSLIPFTAGSVETR